MRALLVVLALLPQSLRSEVYTWQEPQTGLTRISSIAPAWYRQPYLVEAPKGPRVIVTQGTTVIDDTSLPLAERARLLSSPRSSGKRIPPR